MNVYKESVPKHSKTPAVSPLDEIRQNERIRILTEEIVNGKSKRAIITEYSEKWKASAATIKNILNEAIVYLHHIQTGNTIEELRSEQVSKLEELYQQATVSEKLKIIDLQSETLGLYDNNVTIKTDDEIKINLGV